MADALRRSVEGATGLTLRAGVSRVARTPLDVPVAYEQALTAERVGGAELAHFDDLGAFRILSLIEDPGELDAYVADVLGPLAADDPATADLRATLETVLSNNLNIAESARRLHFHYNTLRYRVDKLERILGPFASDPILRLNVELAVQALRLRRRSPAN
jgi:purine catabolism regulator